VDYSLNQKLATTDEMNADCDFLCCSECGYHIVAGKNLWSISSKHALQSRQETVLRWKECLIQTFRNPHGYDFEVVTATLANFQNRGGAFEEHSWFPGYSWTVAECPRCYAHIGWTYRRLHQSGGFKDRNFFVGLILESLIQDDHPLYCKECGNHITLARNIQKFGSDVALRSWFDTVLGCQMCFIHLFENPSGYQFQVLTATSANFKWRGEASAEHSWFPPYAWRIAECPQCSAHLGWSFGDPQAEGTYNFVGLIHENLIQKPWESFGRQGNAALDKYKMNTYPRGICLIVNNLNFHDATNDRIGAECDERELEILFKELSFTVCVKKNLEWDEMRTVAAEFAAKDHSQFDAFVFIAMSHGGDRDVILGVKGRTIRVEDLMAEFNAANCPTLQNKPKLFFIQACRGTSKERVRSDDSNAAFSRDSLTSMFKEKLSFTPFSPESTLPRSVCPQEADFLLAFATAPGYVAWRNQQYGSLFVQHLVEAIRELRHRHHLLDILTEVNKRVVEAGVKDGAAIQIPAPTHTLRAQLYL